MHAQTPLSKVYIHSKEPLHTFEWALYTRKRALNTPKRALYIFQKSPVYTPKSPMRDLTYAQECNRRLFLRNAKEPYIYPKEPCVYAKRALYILKKALCETWHSQNSAIADSLCALCILKKALHLLKLALRTCQKALYTIKQALCETWRPQKCAIVDSFWHTQKSPIYTQMSHIYMPKSPIHSQTSSMWDLTSAEECNRRLFLSAESSPALCTSSYMWYDSFVWVTWRIHTIGIGYQYEGRDSFWAPEVRLLSAHIRTYEMTHSYAGHDASIQLVRVVHTRDITLFEVCTLRIFSYIWNDFFEWGTWLIHTIGMSHPHEGHNSFSAPKARLHSAHMHTCKNDSFVCHTNGISHPYGGHDSFGAPKSRLHSAYIHMFSTSHSYSCHHSSIWGTWLVNMSHDSSIWVMTRQYVYIITGRYAAFTHVPSLVNIIHTCAMTQSYDSYMCHHSIIHVPSRIHTYALTHTSASTHSYMCHYSSIWGTWLFFSWTTKLRVHSPSSIYMNDTNTHTHTHTPSLVDMRDMTLFFGGGTKVRVHSPSSTCMNDTNTHTHTITRQYERHDFFFLGDEASRALCLHFWIHSQSSTQKKYLNV